jgi:hypothetical protein
MGRRESSKYLDSKRAAGLIMLLLLTIAEYEAWKAWLAAAASQCRLTHAYPDYDTCRVSEKMRKIRDKH